VTAFLLPGTRRQDARERAFTGSETLEAGVDLLDATEGIEALGAGTEFARGLRAAQHEHGEQRDLAAFKVEVIG